MGNIASRAAADVELADRSVARTVFETIFQVHAAAYGFTVVLVVLIWAMTGGAGGFWPGWVAGPWGVALAIHAWATWALPLRWRR